MTSTTDTDEHPEVAEISALTDGLLSPSRTASVHRHLEHCVLCADVHASLEEIRSLLGTLPGPTRMPADIAGRIDAALAAEALLDATAPDPQLTVSRETAWETDVTVSRETAPSKDAPNPLRTGEVDRPAGHARATTGPGRKGPRHSTHRARSRSWPRVLLGAACAAAVFGLGSLVTSSGSRSETAGGEPPEATTTSKSGKAALSSENLEAQVQGLLSDRQGRESSRGVSAQNSPDMPLRAPAEHIPSCVQAGTGRTEAPLASRENTFEGVTAYIVVLPHPGDASRVDVFVIDAACAKESAPPPGTILREETYARP